MMFMFDADSPTPVTELHAAAGQLRALADDLDSYADGIWPEAEQLRNAPIIQQYAPMIVPTYGLVGLVTGHPLKPGRDRQIVTSALWTICQPRGWARTLSRYYRLGTPRGGRPEMAS
jgi:hypothetical protein